MLYTEKRGKYHLPNIHVICGDNESVVQSGPCGTIKNRQKESLNKKMLILIITILRLIFFWRMSNNETFKIFFFLVGNSFFWL